MREYDVLKVLDLFQPLIEKFQINYPVLRKILSVKLLMDRRRVNPIFVGEVKEDSHQYLRTLWLYLLYSIVLVYFVFGDAYMLQTSIMFGVALFVLMTALIADFSAALLDVRDWAIIQTKPVDARTVGAAKFIHIFIYLLLVTGAFTIIPAIVMLFVQGIIFTLLFLLLMILFMLFIIASTVLSYFFVLRFLSGEWLRNMINYIQIIFVIGVIIGYQIIIRTYGMIDIYSNYLFKWWHMLLPPMWFAAPFELVLNQNSSVPIILLSVMAIVIPFLFVAMYLKVIPAFEANLQKLSETTPRRREHWFSLDEWWQRLLCRREDTRIYFHFVCKMIEREKEFKLKVYPSLGIGLVLPFIFIFSEARIRTFAEMTDSYLYLCIYLMQMFIGIAIYTFQFSESYKGAWVFQVAEAGLSTQLYQAVMKVFIVKLYLPMLIIVGGIYYILFQPFQLVDIGVVFLSGISQALLSFKISVNSRFPFAEPYGKVLGKQDTTKAFLLIFLSIPFVLLHFAFTLIPFGIYLYLLLLIIGVVLLWRWVFKCVTMHR